MSIATAHTLGSLHTVHLAQVVDNADPDGRGRIKVRMLANDVELWASVVVASAGQGYGVTCLPKIDENVVVAFITPEQPLVIGSIWAGTDAMPSEADAVENHYVVATPAGSILEFDDAEGPKIEIRTRAGYSLTIDEGNDGKISVTRGGQTIEMDSSQVKISGTKVVLDAATIEMNAAQIKASAATSTFSGIIQCNTCISTSVVGTSYTPGAGNIW
jgi:uncharacterized protein involved in type VI secretion and phage assembly